MSANAVELDSSLAVETQESRSGRPARARDARKPVTRRRILQAALGEFSRQGLDGASVKTISERAGVANGTVFWHFKSKWRLYIEVVWWAADEFHRGMLPVVEKPGTSFMQVIDGEIDFLAKNPDINGLMSALRGEHPRSVVREATRRMDDRIVDIWRRWIAANAGAAVAANTNLARLIASTVSGLFATRFIDADVDVRDVLLDFAGLVESRIERKNVGMESRTTGKASIPSRGAVR
ncbi:MAG: TetR/AcrR family transcriptional regulator [Gammaproteobacteria bacterium]|nr:TetR/AcrR family transcriptional regulator [Gammaproteobacteria bacterium]